MEEAFYQAAGFPVASLDNLIRYLGAALICIWCAWLLTATVTGMDSSKSLSSKNILFRYIGALLVVVVTLFIFGSDI